MLFFFFHFPPTREKTSLACFRIPNKTVSRSKSKTPVKGSSDDDASTDDGDAHDDESSSSEPLPAPTTQPLSFQLDPQFVEAVLQDRKKTSKTTTVAASSTASNAAVAASGSAAASTASPNRTLGAFELDTTLAAKILADRERDVWRERTLEDDSQEPTISHVGVGTTAPHSTIMPTQLAQYKAQVSAMAAAESSNALAAPASSGAGGSGNSRSSGTFQLDPSLADKIIADRHADVWHKRVAASDADSDSASNSRSATLRSSEGTAAPHSTAMPTQLAQYKSQVEAMKSAAASGGPPIVVSAPSSGHLPRGGSSSSGGAFELDQALAARILADRQGDVWNKRVAAAVGGADSNSNSASNRSICGVYIDAYFLNVCVCVCASVDHRRCMTTIIIIAAPLHHIRPRCRLRFAEKEVPPRFQISRTLMCSLHI